MVMMVEPLAEALRATGLNTHRVFFTPGGKPMTQATPWTDGLRQTRRSPLFVEGTKECRPASRRQLFVDEEVSHRRLRAWPGERWQPQQPSKVNSHGSSQE